MNDTNTQLIEQFYQAFQKLDAHSMNNCYTDDIVFFDPVFGLLRGEEVKCMWEMLCKNARDFSLTFTNIVALDEEYYTVDWVASYTFSKTKRKVINRVKANMRFAGGKIIEHSDAFSVHKWSKQAFGMPGVLVGWNSFFQGRIKKQAAKNLLAYMQSKV